MKTLREVMIENMAMDPDTIDQFLSYLDINDGEEKGAEQV